MQVTLFPALLVLDAKRQAAAQYDFLPFIVRPSSACPVQWFDSYDGGIDRLMKQVGEFLQLPRVKAAVIIVFITLAGCGIWGLSGLTVSLCNYRHVVYAISCSPILPNNNLARCKDIHVL